jgi:hypothetical protein
MKRAIFCLLLLVSLPARAHVGSPDVFYEGNAGPYHLFVTVQPPEVIPGVAQLQIRGEKLEHVRIVPLPVLGEAAERPPTPDSAQRSSQDPNLYSGSLWLMEAGSWQVRVLVDGEAGAGSLSVPVPALPKRTAGMERALATILLLLMMLLSVGAISIAGAAARESTLPPGQLPGSVERRRGRTTTASALVLVVGALVLGNLWWNSEADDYARYTYKPLSLTPATNDGELQLQLSDPGWLRRRIDDWIPDHDHLMHLFIVKLPELDRVWHLHPEADAPGHLVQSLPAMPAGKYRLFADLVHRSGLAETAVADLELAETTGKPLTGDDSTGEATNAVDFNRMEVTLPDGAKLIREGFRFRCEREGKPCADLEPYMGMLGHAVFLARDLSVFAHIHPTGSIPMAAIQVVDPQAHHHAEAGPSEVSFPYQLPKPGEYRVFVQVKRHEQIQTAAFDLTK